MSTKIKTAIYFSEEEARQYAEYLAEKEKFDIISASAILGTKSGQGVFHFDKDGVIQLIEQHKCLYRRKKL